MPPMLGTWRALAGVCALLALRGSAEAVEDAAAVPSPPAVLWYAPFLSGGGYCSEAHSYVTAISSALRHSQPPEEDANEQETREAGSFSGTGDFGAFSSSSYHDASDERGGAEPPFSLLVTQHGDAISPSFLRDMPEETREMLEQVTPSGMAAISTLLSSPLIYSVRVGSTGSTSATSTGDSKRGRSRWPSATRSRVRGTRRATTRPGARRAARATWWAAPCSRRTACRRVGPTA
jgi:hypothetical protein